MDVAVQIIHLSDRSSSSSELKLVENATIKDLQDELLLEDGLSPDEYRLCYRTNAGAVLLEEEELVTDVQKESGRFEVEIIPLSSIRPEFELSCDTELVGQLAFLIGNKKKFEHFVATRRENRLKTQSCE